MEKLKLYFCPTSFSHGGHGGSSVTSRRLPLQNMYLSVTYTQSHIKSDQPGSHVFRRFLSQLSTDFHEIL